MRLSPNIAHRSQPISNFDKKCQLAAYAIFGLAGVTGFYATRPASVVKPHFDRISSDAAFPSQRLVKPVTQTKRLIDAFCQNPTNVTVGIRPDGVRGLFVARSFRKGDTVISIDQADVIGENELRNLQWVQQCIGISAELDPFFANEHWEASEVALTLALIYERRKGKGSKWDAYLSTLPQNMERVKALPKFRSMARRCSYHIEDLEWDEFFWAISRVSMRKMPAFSTTRQAWETMKSSLPAHIQDFIPVFLHSRFSEALVPILDMANHSDDPTCRYEPFRFVALRDLTEGDEISWNYDPYLHPDEIREKFKIPKTDRDLRSLFSVDMSKDNS